MLYNYYIEFIITYLIISTNLIIYYISYYFYCIYTIQHGIADLILTDHHCYILFLCESRGRRCLIVSFSVRIYLETLL